MSNRFIVWRKVKIMFSMNMVIRFQLQAPRSLILLLGLLVSHATNIFDGHTLPEVLEHIEISRGKAVLQAVCDRGYRGVREVNGTEIILPKKAIKRLSILARQEEKTVSKTSGY